MAPESERPVEKLLRASAEKRRADAGAPLELHPVNRRALQEEVARQFKKEQSSSNTKAVGVRFWPRFAWGLGAFAAATALVLLVLPGLFPAKTRSQFSMAKTEMRDAPELAATEKLSEADVAKSKQSNPPATEENVLAKKAETFMESETRQPAAAVPSQTPATAPQLALRSEMTKEAQITTQLDRLAFGGAQRYGLAGGAPAFKTDAAGENRRQSAAQDNFNYYRATPPAQVANAPASSVSSALPVLASFALQQSGAQLKIKDADGSVYDGFVQNTAELAQRVSGRAQNSTLSRSFAPAGAADTRLKDLPASEPQAGSNFFFRVVGTNQTLNQQVVFTGNLFYPPVALTGATSSLGVVAGLGALTQTNEASQNSRISGKALLDGAKEIEINAVQGKP